MTDGSDRREVLDYAWQRWNLDVIIRITSDSLEEDDQYAFSPDGVGLYWYESLEEAWEAHGELPVYQVPGPLSD